MPDQQLPKYYQAPLEVNSYVNPTIAPIPKQPVDIYGLLKVAPKITKKDLKEKTPYELMEQGFDPYGGIIPDKSPLQTNLATLEPLDDPAGIFHSQDGFGKYGYSSILGGGDNEARYADNFRRDNPHLFWRDGFHPFEGIQKGIYWGGGFLEKTLESAVIKTGQGLAGLYGLTVGNVVGLKDGGYNGLSDWIARSTDNIFSDMFNGWDENLKQRYHYFQEKSDRDKKGFIASLSDGDFWMNDISDGLGFLVSAAFEVGLISKLNLGAKLASRIAPLAEGTSSAAIGGTEAATLGGRFLKSVGGANKFANAVDITTQTLATTTIESAVEANEVKQQVYDSFENKVNPETGFYYTEEEKNRLSAAAASQVFKQNMAILIGPQFLQTMVFNRIGKAIKGAINKGSAQAEIEAGKASNKIRSRLGNLSSGTTYDKSFSLRNVWKYGSAAPIGFISEGLWEENMQLAISRTAEEGFGAGNEFYRPDTRRESDALDGETFRKYRKQIDSFFKGVGDSRFIDDELSKSVGIGGMFGVGGGVVHNVLGYRQQLKVDKYWNEKINGATKSLFESQNFFKTEVKDVDDPKNPGQKVPKELPVIDPKTGQPVIDENKVGVFLNNIKNIEGILDIIRNTEDTTDELNKTYQNKELNKLARNVLFTKLAMEYIRAGKKGVLLANLASTTQFSDKDIQALGYEPGNMSEDEKKNMLTKMTALVERLDKSDKWIEDNIVDNVSEPRQGFAGLKYTKTQKEKRKLEFDAKKAYLRNLAMQRALLGIYRDELAEEEAKLGEVVPEILSSVLDENGVPVTDLSTPLSLISKDWNSKIPALRNQIDVLEKEFVYHWDDLRTDIKRSNPSPKGQSFTEASKSFGGSNIVYKQMKAQETLEKLNELQAELDKLTGERDAFLRDNDNYELVQDEDHFFVAPRKKQKSATERELDRLQNEKRKQINAIKLDEIGIQEKWLDKEWQATAALKEEKTKAERQDSRFSRRMTGSHNTYNQYYQREVITKDSIPGERKMKLYDKEESKRVGAKKYKANEDKILNSVRIEGKIKSIIARINGQKLLTEIQALLERNLPSGEFTNELKKITDNYNGKPVILSENDKKLIDAQIEATEDEADFAHALLEYAPEDDRFNEKYYDVDPQGYFVPKPQYDSLPAMAQVQKELTERINDLKKIKAYLNSIPEKIEGDWNNVNIVKRRIADVYIESADGIINDYNNATNNGQSELTGEILSTKQDLDRIDNELDELGQLKTIFENRTKSDMILVNSEFSGFIKGIEDRIEKLTKIKEVVKERIASRLKENQDFLVDSINNFTEQLGIDFNGAIINQSLHDEVEKVVGKEALDKLKQVLTDLKAETEKPDQTKDDKKKIVDTYWTVNGHVSAIQELIKSKDKKSVIDKVSAQKKDAISKLEKTSLMQKLKDEDIYPEIIDNIGDSLLGALQTVFYNTTKNAAFTQIGLGGTDGTFLDDQPSSPVYRFREDYNLRKFLRAVEKDNSRTPDNSSVSKDELIEFLQVAKEIQNLEDLEKSLNSSLNLLAQVELERKVVNSKIENAKDGNKDTTYENLIVTSIQQIFFIRSIASFIKRQTGVEGFRNWIYIQAPGGAGKTSTLGTWFNIVSDIPRDRVLATAFTEEASRGIRKALIVGEKGPKDAAEMAEYIKKLTKDKNFDQEVLIIDEFPAIDIVTQKALFEAISEYSEAKLKADKGEFKVITMGDTNQLTFDDSGAVTARPTILVNPNYFNGNKNKGNGKHPAKMNIIPSLTVNFRSNLFPVTSFIETFKGSNKNNVNADIKVTSTDPTLNNKDVKGVVAVSKADFKTRIVNYIKKNAESTRTRTLIVNESKLEEYRKVLQDAGISIITDPNDQLTKGGVYLTTVKNVQGFSFDEVFIDLDSNDKVLFKPHSNPDYLYNKAMYVATSRARNLIVVTNFANIKNLEDTGIDALESKAIAELQVKDSEFLANRDLEIQGSKNILGDDYDSRVKTVVKTPTAKPSKVVEAPLGQDTTQPTTAETLTKEEEVKLKKEENAVKQDTQESEPEVEPQTQPKTEETTEEPETQKTEEPVTEEPEEIIPVGGEVVAASGDEVEEDAETTSEKTKEEFDASFWDKVQDEAVKAYHKIKNGIVELLFPTAQTTKYKIRDGEFSNNLLRLGEGYENQALKEGDNVMIIPFKQRRLKEGKTYPRKFGYAVVTPAIDEGGDIIPNKYRTVSVLSDREIDGLDDHFETRYIYDAIRDNETRDQEFVFITYDDVSLENGFETTGNKLLGDPIAEGVVAHSNSVKYFYGNDYRPMNAGAMHNMIEEFIKKFYANHLDNFRTEEAKNAELARIREWHNRQENTMIVIPNDRDVKDTPRRKANFAIPPELKDTFVKSGRPYLLLKPIHTASDWQFIPLSRKFLTGKYHGKILNPIREFISLGRRVKEELAEKGADGAFGFNKNMNKFLSLATSIYTRDNTQDTYEVPYNSIDNEGNTVTTVITLTNPEIERVYRLFRMYQEPSTQFIRVTEPQDIQRLVGGVNKTLIFEGTDLPLSIVGKIVSFDPNTNTYVVEDKHTKEQFTKSGPVSYAMRIYNGPVQQILDNIVNSNGHISKNYVSESGRIGFVTPKGERLADNQLAPYRGYKFMALLGVKASNIVKTYGPEGEVTSFYEDVFEILDDLFNFGDDEMQPVNIPYMGEDGAISSMDIKFRVPVPTENFDEDPDYTHNYTYSSENTSRINHVPNSIYFETNFESMEPTRVLVDFAEGGPKAPVAEAVEEVAPEVTPEVVTPEVPPTPIVELTEDEVKRLPLSEIRQRLTPQQEARLLAYITDPEIGFTSLDEFWSEVEASADFPDVLETFRSYILNCLV
jgi:hypothetical protein